LLPPISEVRKRRIKLGLSTRKLAAQVGTTPSTITKIEKGRLNPSYSMVSRIFSFLDSLQSPNEELVRDISTKKVFTVQAEDKVADAITLLQKHGFKQLPVMEGQQWVGSLFERTITRQLIKAPSRTVLDGKVSDIMDELIPILPEETRVALVIPLLQETQAILTSKAGKITGIVTNSDLLKIAVEKS
jgi:predicted transcriptional regulator